MITVKQVDNFTKYVSAIVAFLPMLVAFTVGMLVLRPLGIVAGMCWDAFLEGWKL